MEKNVFQVIWFILWSVLWIGYFVLDGFDLGAGFIRPLVARDDRENRLIYNAIGPFWDANEVWLITAGGATFAAFPRAYAVMFSALYSALLLLLFCLILRGVALEFRGKEQDPGWRSRWDKIFTGSSLLATLLLGVAFANIFRGVPIDGKGIIHGGLFSLLNPYGLLGGLLFVSMFAVHGAIWLYFRCHGEFAERAKSFALRAWGVEVAVAIVFMLASLKFTSLWDNYEKMPVLLVFPVICVLSLLGIAVMLRMGKALGAWIASALTIACATAWGTAGLFPNLLPSSIDIAYSLTIYNSSSSLLTLKIMTVVALVFVPVMLAYKFWTYRTFATKLTDEDIYGGEAY